MVRRRSPFKIVARAIGLAAFALVCLFVGLVALYDFATPVSTLMLARKIEGKAYERLPVRLGDVAAVIASVIASEDATFCRNDGVDWGALHEVIGTAGSLVYGAHPRSPCRLRKICFSGRAVQSCARASKSRWPLSLARFGRKGATLEIYLNIAEWGDGLFGVEAAARRYFHKHASELDAREAALLATSLPKSIERNPSHPRLFQQRLAAALEAKASRAPEAAGCLARSGRADANPRAALPATAPSPRLASTPRKLGERSDAKSHLRVCLGAASHADRTRGQFSSELSSCERLLLCAARWRDQRRSRPSG